MGIMPRLSVEEPNATAAASSTSPAICVRLERRMWINSVLTPGCVAPSKIAWAIAAVLSHIVS